MQTLQKPHISPALAHLRSGVTTAALVAAACAVLQLLVFGFVHFTQVRYDQAKPQPASQTLSVVVGARPAAAMRPAAAKSAQPAPAEAAYQGSARTLSAWDPALHVLSDAAVVVGILSSCCLALLVGLGVVVAAGGAVPGVERAVWSMSWALLLCLAALPWRGFFSTVPFPGVFGGYEDLTAVSEAVDAGQSGLLSMMVTYFAMPLAVFGAAMLTLARFRSGVAQGILITSVSELDDKLEREMATIRSRGVAPAGISRAMGALNTAIGETPGRQIIAEASAPVGTSALHPMKHASPAEPKTARGWLTRRDRRMGEPDAGDPLKRPL